MKRIVLSLAVMMGALAAAPANACQLVCLLASAPVAPTTNEQQCNTTYPGFHFAKPGIMSSLPGDKAELAGATGGPSCGGGGSSGDTNLKNAIDYFFARYQGVQAGMAGGGGYPTSWQVMLNPLFVSYGSGGCPGTGNIVCCNM